MNLVPDDRDPTRRFVRGLTLGALLGAVIAGSSLWSRARARRGAGTSAIEPRTIRPTEAPNDAGDAGSTETQ